MKPQEQNDVRTWTIYVCKGTDDPYACNCPVRYEQDGDPIDDVCDDREIEVVGAYQCREATVREVLEALQSEAWKFAREAGVTPAAFIRSWAHDQGLLREGENGA